MRGFALALAGMALASCSKDGVGDQTPKTEAPAAEAAKAPLPQPVPGTDTEKIVLLVDGMS